MTTLSPARVAALDRLAKQAARFPDLEFVDSGAHPIAGGLKLDARDVALSRAIEHAVVGRWLTLAAVCRACIDRRWENVDSRIQAALLAGAAQLLLFGQQADHAVVDDTVEWSKRKGRRGSPGFVNAVLRKIAGLRGPVLEAKDPNAAPAVWHDRCDALPLDDGRVLQLTQSVFSLDRVARLAEQTSHGEDLILHWFNAAGRDAAFARAVHGLTPAPTILAGVPVAPLAAGGVQANTDAAQYLTPHSDAGSWVWNGPHAELVKFLAANPHARVQDTASARPVQLSAALRPKVILDACAGRGTKTRQLTALHPDAEIVATDVESNRLHALALAFEGHPQVKVTTPKGLRRVIGRCDLVLLDVPCSNTGVLARRPEARYRFTRARLDGLISLQRTIVNEHLPFVGPAGHVLFSTCSLEASENEQQGEWIAKRAHATPVRQERQEPRGVPGGDRSVYSDGSFGFLAKLA